MLAGAAAGLLFGDYAAVLQVVADGYIRLLQMTVLPYVTVSIIGGLGALDCRAGADAREAGRRRARAALGGRRSPRSLLFPLMFPAHAERVVLQHDAARGARAVRLPRASTSRPTRSTRSPTTSCRRSCCSASSSAWR